MRLSKMTNGKLINLAKNNNTSAIKELNKRGVSFDAGRMYDSKNMINTSDINKVIKYYSTDMRVKIEKYIPHSLLNDKDLILLCEKIVLNYIADYKKNKSKKPLGDYIIRRINNFLKRTDKEKLYKYYIVNVKLTDSIKDFFYETYKYLIKQENIDESVYKIKLIELLASKKLVSIDVKVNLIKKIKEHKEMVKKLNRDKYKKEMEKLIYNEEYDIDFIYEYNYYIINEIYDKYKDKYEGNNNELRDFLVNKYDDYFYRYIELSKENNVLSELREYLYNSLNNIFKANKLPIIMTDELKKEKETNKIGNESLIYKVMMDNLEEQDYLNDEIYKELLKEYEISSNLYYERQRTSNYKDYIERRLIKKIKDIKG